MVPLQPILPTKPIELITADILGPIKPKSKAGHEHVLVICDHFTKYTEAFPLRNTDALSVAKCMVKFISRHGIPDEILTDQGRNFQSELLENLYRLLDITRKRTAAYHPQTDGITERFVSTIKNMIRTYIGENPQDWDQQLDILCFAYNTSTHATTKFSPLFLMTIYSQKKL